MLGVLLSSKRSPRPQGVALASSLEAPRHPHPRLLLTHHHQPSIQQMCLQVLQSREVEQVPHPRVQSLLTSLLSRLASRPVRAQLMHLQPLQAQRRLAVQQQPQQPPPKRPSLLRILLQNRQFDHLLLLPSQLVATPVLQFLRVNCQRVDGQQTTSNVADVKVLIHISGGHVMLNFAIALGKLLLIPIIA